jgi:HK97 family phage major capsid protein
MSQALIKLLSEQRMNIFEGLKATYAVAEVEKRDLTAEEQASEQQRNADLDSLSERIKTLQANEQRNADIAASIAAHPQVADDPREQRAGAQDPSVELRDFLAGRSGKEYELRAPVDRPFGSARASELRDLSKLTAGAGANTVKIGFYERLMAHMIEVSGMLRAGATILNTTSGEQIQIPKTTAHSSAALTAEGAAITESDPTFGQTPLDAFKYANLIQISRELVTDTSVDLLGYVAMQAGRAVGNAFGAHLVLGTGSAQPQGIAPVASVGVTGGAGVAGAFTADNLIDLFYSVIEPYRMSQSCGWLLRDATMASVRKLKDGNGAYIWSVGTGGAPDEILGKPVRTDPNVAAVALGARSVLFGDMGQYFVRLVNGIRFERSDDFAFSTDLVTFRTIIRGDGDLVDLTGAVKAFVGNAA